MSRRDVLKFHDLDRGPSRDQPQRAVLGVRADGSHLKLSVENDFDRDGRAVMDEFSDEISACTRGGFDGNLRVISMTEINHET
jgi:hypothetical protein